MLHLGLAGTQVEIQNHIASGNYEAVRNLIVNRFVHERHWRSWLTDEQQQRIAQLPVIPTTTTTTTIALPKKKGRR